jgi:hypothetical protein
VTAGDVGACALCPAGAADSITTGALSPISQTAIDLGII